MSKFRIYAKLIGYVLPAKEGGLPLYGCVIKQMNEAEQVKRGFKPIEIDIGDPGDTNYYRSYLTSKIYSDDLYIKTDYVIYCDVEAHDEGGALGAATKLFNKVAGSLALATSDWFNTKHNRSDYKNYEYQISRIYKLNEMGHEEPSDKLPIMGRGWSMINLPASTDFDGTLNKRLINRLLACDEEIFRKSSYYLLRAEQDFNRRVAPEMLTINLFKCVELIVNSFRGRKFKDRLAMTAKTLGLTAADIKSINELKQARDNGDVAHPRTGRRADYYPPQFPIPENVDYPNFWYSGLVGKVLLRYFLYVSSAYEIRIERDDWRDKDSLHSVNFGSYYTINPSIRGRKKLVPYLKRKLATSLKVPYSSVRLRKYSGDKVIFEVLNHLNYDLDDDRTGGPPKFL
jgi:hypothetical protein